jgi:DNA-binding PadR family transcriptional regulator
VRTSFKSSPSSYWSASAGAIYPLLGRLEKRGLLTAREEARGSRKRRLLTVTDRGRRALRDWLAAGVDATSAAAVFDAVRTRVFFLGALTARQRRSWARKALRELERHLTVIELDLEEARRAGDSYWEMGALGAWHTARARVAWMEEVSRLLSKN